VPLVSLTPGPSRVLGIDVGGSKTHLALATGSVIERERVVATDEWRTGVLAQDAAALAALIREQWGVGALAHPLAVGAHGCDTTQQCLDLERELRTHVSGGAIAVNDAELMPWAMGVHDGIGLVAGTGSIAVARDRHGDLVTAGGWGWVLGDEGSAAGIVREATRAVLADLDHGRSGDPLVTALLAGFAVTNGAELAMAVTRTSSAYTWGSHAPAVFTAADEGSTLAATVIDGAGRQLAGLVPRLRARGVTTTDLVAGGGVIIAQPRLRDAFLAGLAQGSPDITVRFLDTPPVVGAIALATSRLHAQPSSPAPSPARSPVRSAQYVPEVTP
jgi:N-acetylglucosamine kinase-like BadF-type ATPase